MGVFVKICGNARAEDVAEVAALKPDAMGFIFWPASPRAVDPEAVAEWTRSLDPAILKVGVFADESPERVLDVVRRARLQAVQLHGSEPPDQAARIPGRVWKVIHLDRLSPEQAAAYSVDAFLIDSYSSRSPGGTGKVVDWNRARAFVETAGRPVLLAGGLTPGNVAEAIRTVRPWGVDVASGLEQEPGRKDINLVKAFIEACRNS
jgi:phosphoribosylanthranilate isomerase